MPTAGSDPLVDLYMEAFEATVGRPDLERMLVAGIVDLLAPYAHGLKALTA